MAHSPRNQRFFTSTRGRIIILLRRVGQTVEELAQTLQLTDNAVRAHLTTLERDGLVQPSGTRRGSGKPSILYTLTSNADTLFPKAYDQVFRQLLDILQEHMTSQELETVMRTAGQRIAATQHARPGGLSTRLEGAVEVLNGLGGLAELETQDDSYTIRGYSCPLAALVPTHPEVCQLAETLLTELVGVPVQEQCNRNKEGHCYFVVPKTE